jgi:UDP-3-O-[3-hydroxymyristoyl] glucosamine N-acyltransferase
MKFFKKKLYVWADSSRTEPTDYMELAELLGWKPILVSNEKLTQKMLAPNLNFILALKEPEDKAKLYAFLISSGQKAVSLIHPQSFISKSTNVLDGSFVGANTSIGNTCIVGYGVHISQNCSISSSCFIGDFTSLESSVDIQKGVQTGKECYLSSRSGINKDLVLGCSVFADSGIQIKEDIPSYSILSSKFTSTISKLC